MYRCLWMFIDVALGHFCFRACLFTNTLKVCPSFYAKWGTLDTLSI